MDTYWLTGKHGVLPDRRPYSGKEEDMEFMADNPHSESGRRPKEEQSKHQSSFAKTIGLCKELLG